MLMLMMVMLMAKMVMMEMRMVMMVNMKRWPCIHWRWCGHQHSIESCLSVSKLFQRQTIIFQPPVSSSAWCNQVKVKVLVRKLHSWLYHNMRKWKCSSCSVFIWEYRIVSIRFNQSTAASTESFLCKDSFNGQFEQFCINWKIYTFHSVTEDHFKGDTFVITHGRSNCKYQSFWLRCKELMAFSLQM